MIEKGLYRPREEKEKEEKSHKDYKYGCRGS